MLKELLELVARALSPDATVQAYVRHQLQHIQSSQQYAECALLGFIHILTDRSLEFRIRQTACVLAKLFVPSLSTTTGANTSMCPLREILARCQEQLLVTLSDDIPLLQTAVAMLISSCVRSLTLAGWPTLLQSISACAAAGVQQQHPQYLVGVVRCLSVLFEDCPGELASLCEDPEQLSGLCGILEQCINGLVSAPLTASAADGRPTTTTLHIAVTWRACELMFSTGVVPQSLHILQGDGGSDSDSDEGNAFGSSSLAVVGKSPQRSNRPKLSRGQRKIHNQYILRRLRTFVDNIVDSVRAAMRHPVLDLLAFETQQQHQFGNPAVCNMALVSLLTQLVGYWERAGLLLAEVLPKLLTSVEHASLAKRRLQVSDDESTPLLVAIVDLITELAQDDAASNVVAAHLPSIVQSLLCASLLTQPEMDELVGANDNKQEPDDERKVLVSLSRRGVSLGAHAMSTNHDSPGDEPQRDDDDAIMGSGPQHESDGSQRDAVSWCWNCLSVADPESLSTVLVPILIDACMTAANNGDVGIVEAALYTLSDVIDEIFPYVPPHVITGFLQQCEQVLLHDTLASESGGASSPMALIGRMSPAVRRQSVRCIEHATVGSLTTSPVDMDDADDDLSAVPSTRSIDIPYVLRILTRCMLHDSNKMVQEAAIRALDNITTHALKLPADGCEDDDGADGWDGTVEEYAIGIADVVAFYEAAVGLLNASEATSSRPLQLRAKVALCDTLGRIAESDAAAVGAMHSNVASNAVAGDGPARTVCAELLTCLLKAVNTSCSSNNGAVVRGLSSVADILSLLSALCNVLESSRPENLTEVTSSGSGMALTTFLESVWSMCGSLVVAGGASNSVTIWGTFTDEVCAIAIDCVCATCDILLEDEDDHDEGTHLHKDLIRTAFLSSSVAASCFEKINPSRGENNDELEVDPNLRRACFGLR